MFKPVNLIASFVCAFLFTAVCIAACAFVKIVLHKFGIQWHLDLKTAAITIYVLFFIVFQYAGYQDNKKEEEYEKIIKSIEPESDERKKEFYKTGIKIFSKIKMK